MKKFKNGVPMLSKSAMDFINLLIARREILNAEVVAISLTPKSKYRGRKIKVVEVQANGGNGYFIWYDGYHYRFVSSFVFAPLNLRKKRVILYCKKTYGLKKKGSK